MKNHYDILGVAENASLDEIKKAYRKLSMKFHPDKNENDEYFSDMFKRITEAYDTLSDSTKRKKYDSSINSANSYTEEIQIDPLFFDAAMLFVSQQAASAAILQRKFTIGYSQAGRIMDQLENAGIIGPFNGTFREVLLSKQDFESKYNLNIKEEFTPQKTTENKSRKTDSSSAPSVWDKVKAWKRVKRIILIIDIVLLGILFKDSIFQKLNSDNSPKIEENSYNGVITSSNGLRMRTDPNENAPVLLTIPSNGKIIIINSDGPTQTIEGSTANWYQVKYKNQIGWVWGGFVIQLK